jgi:hypothetical protein
MFKLEILLESLRAMFVSNSALFQTSVWGIDDSGIHVIDGHAARIDSLGKLIHLVEIIGVCVCCQTIRRRIGQFYGFVQGAECHDTNHRAEGLLGHHEHPVIGICQDSRLEEISLLEFRPLGSLSTTNEPGAFGKRVLDVPLGLFETLPACHGAEVAWILLESIPDNELSGRLAERIQEALVHGLLDIDPVDGDADLPHVAKGSTHGPLDGIGDVAVSAYNKGTMPSQFQRDLLYGALAPMGTEA